MTKPPLRRESPTYPPLQPGEDRLIPIPRVVELTGYGKTSLYLWIREGSFPKPCHPGGASSRWSEREILDWIKLQLESRS